MAGERARKAVSKAGSDPLRIAAASSEGVMLSVSGFMPVSGMHIASMACSVYIRLHVLYTVYYEDGRFLARAGCACLGF